MPDLLGVNLFNAAVADRLREESERSLETARAELDELTRGEMNPSQQRRTTFLRLFAEERATHGEMFDKGQLSEAAYRQLTLNLDVASDAMRYRGVLLVAPADRAPHRAIERSILSSIDRLYPASRFAERLRLRRVALDYDAV